MLKGCWLTRTFFAGGSPSSASSAFLFLPRDLGGAEVSSPAGSSSLSALGLLERGFAGAFLGAGSGSNFGCSLMRAERRGARSASAGEEEDLGLATIVIDDESRRKERVGVYCSCERAV